MLPVSVSAERIVQVLLLRALESQQIHPVGARKPQQVDVRFISATDRNLETSIQAGKFLSPLLYRLSNYTIELPPLRERREDFGRLFFHFLRQELKVLEEEDHLRYRGTYDWPGNVRQLQNVVRELAVSSRGFAEVQRVPKIERLLQEGARHSLGPQPPAPSSSPVRSSSSGFRDPDSVPPDELMAALETHHFVVNQAAAHLGISRPSFYKLMQKYQIRKAGDLSCEEIEHAWYRCRSDIESMVDELKVSKKGLKDRMKELGLR